MKTITYDESKWKLVPVEPTDEMLEIGAQCVYEPTGKGDIDDVWANMLAAAPSAPATAQGGVYSTDPLACSGCVSGCFRCRSVKVQGDGWIPVSERLPEPETDVLVRGVRRNEVMHNVAGVFNGEWSSQETEDLIRGEVTHWMPLPAAPGAAPSAPKADDPVKVQLLEALELVVQTHDQGGWPTAAITIARAAIAAARKGEGE